MPCKSRLLCFLVGCFFLTLFSAGAAEPETTGYRMSLFDGQSLDGWTITGCKAAVENGLLVIQEGNGFLRTHHRYADFVLEVDWKARGAKDYDSGIYFRSEAPVAGQNWPKQYQINLKQGDEGNCIGVPTARSQGLIKPGEWNHFQLTVRGDKAEMQINGMPAWKCAGIEGRDGYLGIQVEVPGGGQFEFKNIFVTELGHRPLLNGQDLTGWEGAGKEAAACWKVERGELVCTGQDGPWLRSKEEHGDFDLRLEYKLKPGGNSGVFVRVPADGAHHGAGSGVEIQILDDKAERYKDVKPYQLTGSVYGIAPAKTQVGLEAGHWNTLEIICRKFSYRVIHNGVVIVDASEKEFPELKERRERGFLGLQNHSEEVWFRNLRIGPAE